MPLSPYEETLSPQEDNNPYRQTLQLQDEVSHSVLLQSAKQASATAPDRQAQILKLSDSTGLPASVVDRNFDAIQKRSEITGTDYSQMLRETPHLANYLSDPSNAAVSKDDHPQLGAIEHMLNFAKNGVRSLAASFPATNAAVWGALQAPADLLSEYVTQPLMGGLDPFAKLSKQFQEYRRQQEQVARNVRPWTVSIDYNSQYPNIVGVDNAGFTEKAVYQGLESLGQNALMMIPALLAGPTGEAAVLAGMGLVTGGQSYGQAKDQGVGTAAATQFALSQGLIEVATERIPVHTLFKGLEAHTGFFKLLAKELASEIPGEEIATVLQDLNEWSVLPENQSKTFRNYLEERPSAAAATAIATIVGTVGQVGITRIVDKAFLPSLGKAVQDSKTFGRLPDKVREFLATASKDTPVENVYLPVEDVKQYWQDQKQDPAAAMEQLTPDGRQKYEQALQTGGTIEMPLADYATTIANTDHGKFFNDVARLGSPEAMNEREKVAFREQLDAQQKDVSQNVGSDPAAQIREDIIGQMVNTGFDRRSIDAYAGLYESVFRTMGERAGVDPRQLYEQYKLKITRPIPEVLQSLGHIDQFDALLDRLRAGDVPQKAEVFGPSLFDFLREKGGVQDFGGELQTLEPDAGLKPFQKKLVQPKGLPLDTAREAAVEAGYLDEQATLADFLNKIDAEARGAPVYAQQAVDPAKLEQMTLLNQLEGYLKSAGVDLGTSTNEEVKQVLMQASIAPQSGMVLNQGDQQFAEGKRGAIRFGADRHFTIELLEKADLSTFLHESGHFFLETFGDTVEELLTRPGDLDPMQQQMVEDYGVLLKNLNVSDRSMIGTEQHEQFARMFEAYAREGKAPSTELRPIFARFRSWLVSIYQSLKQLHVTLTPEVRGVMDRLLASDRDIEIAQQQAGMDAMFTDAQQAGMSEKEFSAYRETVQQASDRAKDQLQRTLMEEYNRERETWWQAQRELVHADVSREVQGQRDYLALAFLQKGTLPDGSPLPAGVTAVKLSKDALVQQYGKDFLKRLPRPYVYSREGGVAPTVAAELFGYSSGDELVQAIVNARPMNALINAETDSRMRERYGDMLLDGSAADKARTYVMTEGRSEILQAEMRALAKKQREVRPFLDVQDARAREGRQLVGSVPPIAVVRSWAETRVAGMPVRELNPNTYWMAARKAGRLAFDALGRQDFDSALLEKRKELMNVELYRAVTDAREETQKSVEYIRSFQETAKRQRIGKAGGDYLDQIDGLLDRFDFAKISQKAADRRQSLNDWIADQEKQGLPVEIPAELRNEARRQNYQTMSVEQLQGLRDSVKMIEHLARLKNKLLKSQGKRELDLAVGEITGSIGGNAKGPPQRVTETRLPGDQAARKIGEFFASHRKLSSFIREMDGFHDGGTMWEYILRPINEAADQEAVRSEQATIALAKIFDDAYRGQESSLYQKTFIPAIHQSLSKMARVMVALNWGNDGNRQRVTGGGIVGVGPMNEAQVKAILDTLDERDVKFANSVWAFIHSYWDEIAAKEKRVSGVAPDKVEGVAFAAKGGDFTGGYFPIKYENRLSARASSNLEGDFADSIKQAGYVRATTRRGHTEARVEKVTEPIRGDFPVIFEHVQQVIHDLTHHEMLIDVGRLLGNRKVQDTIYAHYGDVVYENMKGALRDIAFGNAPAPSWYRPINALRQGVVTASLGWNFVTSILQPFQVSNAMVRIGPKWVMKGAVRWLSDAASMNNTVTWIHSQSDFMRLRGKTQMREINEIRNQVGLNRGKVSSWINDTLTKLGADHIHIQAATDSYFYFIQKAQQIADMPTWLGAYEKAMADPENNEKKAIAMADQAVIDSQGSGHIKDLAAVERGPVSKIFTTFYSYQNLLLNQSIEAFKKTKLKDPVSLGRLTVDSMMLLFVPAAIAFGIHRLASGGDDDWMTTLVRQEISQFAGMFVGARELTGAIEGRPDYNGPASLRFMESFYRLAQQGSQGKLDPAFWHSLNESAGTFFHYPATQVQRTAEGVEALWEGKTTNPAVLLFGPPR